MVILGENKIKTLDDLGDLASDELLELLPEGILDVNAANELIMSAELIGLKHQRRITRQNRIR